MTLEDRQRIMVIGSGGAGKSTFARQLAALTGLPVIHLDRHYWRPGWERTPTAEWNGIVQALAAGASWIIDGNYTRLGGLWPIKEEGKTRSKRTDQPQGTSVSSPFAIACLGQVSGSPEKALTPDGQSCRDLP
jgi:energy-coupling factor transporter ATP-binding protein EcfA2